MAMNQKAKKSYLDKGTKKSYLDKGPTKEQLERRNFIKGRLFEDDDGDIDFTELPKKSTKRGPSKSLSPKRITKPKARLIKGRLFEDDDEDIDFIELPKKSTIRGPAITLSPKRITKPKARRSIGLFIAQSSEDLRTMRRQSRIMPETEPKEKATPMENAARRVRERKALEKSKSDVSVQFALKKSIQQQDTSGPGFLSRGLKVLENLYDDCA
jgi:hypothetical protein